MAKSNNNGVTTRFVLDGWNVRLELDGGAADSTPTVRLVIYDATVRRRSA